MTDDIERRIRRDLDAIGAAVPIGEGATPAVGVDSLTARRIRRSLAYAATAGVVLLIGVFAWVTAGSDGADGTDVAGTTMPADAAPERDSTDSLPGTTSTAPIIGEAPPSENGPHRIWMSTDVVSATGTDVTFAVVGPPIEGEVWGTATLLERWTGETWQAPDNAFGYCGLDWTCSLNQQSPADVVLLWEDGVLGRETVNIAGLDDGWYRLRKTIEGMPATAVFRSVAADVAPSVAPTLPWPGAEAALAVSPLVVDSTGSWLTIRHNYRDTNAVLVDVEVGRWNGDEWQPLFAVDAGTVTPYAVMVPALAPGAYRVTAGGEPDGIEARFWVADDIPNAMPCHTAIDQDHLFGETSPELDGPRPPADTMRSSHTSGGFRTEWTVGDQTVRYSFPAGGVTDLVGERVASEGPVQLWYRGDRVEAWVQLAPCGGQDSLVAGIEVSGGDEQDNVEVALALGRGLAQTHHPGFQPPRLDACPGPDSPDPATPNAVHTVWFYCSVDATGLAELVPVKSVFSPDDSFSAVIRRGLDDPPSGLQSAIPVELRGSETSIDITDGVLTIGWGWDFAANPINNITTSAWSGRIVAQVAANAFQFDEIDAIDLSSLPGEHGGEFIYTREQWEQTQADE